MNQQSVEHTPKPYRTDVEYEYSGIINALNYICQEAQSAKLELVSLHLNIAIAELKEYSHPMIKSIP